MAKFVEVTDGTRLKTTTKKNLALVVKRDHDSAWEIFSYHNRVDLAERQIQLHGLQMYYDVEIAPVA